VAADAVHRTEKPSPQIYRRGQFMFNRRFFETKFRLFSASSGAKGDKDMVLLVKTPRGQYEAQRITRIAANDMHIEVMHGAARQEVMVPFGEIQEIHSTQGYVTRECDMRHVTRGTEAVPARRGVFLSLVTRHLSPV